MVIKIFTENLVAVLVFKKSAQFAVQQLAYKKAVCEVTIVVSDISAYNHV